MARIIITLFAPLFYFFFFSLLSQETMSQPQLMRAYCNTIENFTQASSYETNRETLFSSLRESSSLGTYSNATIGLKPDTVYGTFLCRGDINTTSCSDCVRTATIQIGKNCSFNKEAVIYYEECMVRYSNYSFFSLLQVSPSIVVYSLPNASNPNRFNQTLFDKFKNVILNVSSTSLIPYYVKVQERVTELEGSYELESMVQCSPDLILSDCILCLRFAFLRVTTCCGSPSSAQVFTLKCLLKYKTSALPSSAPPPS